MSRGGRRRAAALALAAFAPAPAALSQGDPPVPSGRVAAEAALLATERAAEKARREERLRLLEGRLREDAAVRGRLRDEIAGLRADRARLAAALVATAAAVGAAETRMAEAEAKLDRLALQENAIRLAFLARQDEIAQVLAALQRLGRNPPPALLVRPDDVLAALRGGALLGGAAPALDAEARRLAADLAERTRLRDAIAAERSLLDAEVVTLAAERDRLAALVGARQERLVAAEAEFGGVRARSEALGGEATSLKDLIDRLGQELDDARRAESAARESAEAEAWQVRERIAAAAAREPVRLAPRQAFADLRGALGRPVAGSTLREFGASDGTGGTLRGVALGTRARAVVTSPADGTIAYAGPFRSYGRVLIISVGDGYTLLLAGLERSSVAAGQFVLAGEPVGEMGEKAAASAAMGVVEAEGPVLYVEFRKDGGPVDPGPWWARSQSERARG